MSVCTSRVADGDSFLFPIAFAVAFAEEVPDVVDAAVACRDAVFKIAQADLHRAGPGQNAFGSAVAIGDVGGFEGAFGFFEGFSRMLPP